MIRMGAAPDAGSIPAASTIFELMSEVLINE